MTKHTNTYLDSASRRQRGLLSTRTSSGQAATKFGLAVDQRGWPTLWRLKGYGPSKSQCPWAEKPRRYTVIRKARLSGHPVEYRKGYLITLR